MKQQHMLLQSQESASASAAAAAAAMAAAEEWGGGEEACRQLLKQKGTLSLNADKQKHENKTKIDNKQNADLASMKKDEEGNGG